MDTSYTEMRMAIETVILSATKTERQEIMERIIDRVSLRGFLEMVSEIARDKADHLTSNWQDDEAARRWEKAAGLIDSCARKVRDLS